MFLSISKLKVCSTFLRKPEHFRFCKRGFAIAADSAELKPWEQSMSDEKFELMKKILACPSPVNLEGAMTKLIKDETEKFMPDTWKVHTFRGNAGIVIDTIPEEEKHKDKLTCMIIGHADKIRLQIKSIGKDGKIFVDSDSHLPLTLLGNEVTIFSEDSESPGDYRSINGGTIEALGAIHFAPSNLRTGAKGIKPEDLYIELGIHGENKQEQVVEGLGLRPGDSVLMNRPIRKSVGKNAFQGAYLDNGLGCFVTHELSRMLADKELERNLQIHSKLRLLFSTATHEEIGRFGSRVMVQKFRPDVVIAVDVNHDYVAAPNVASKKFPDIAMGKGPTYSIGSVTSVHLNKTIQKAALRSNIPIQPDVVGRDTGTDAMAGVLASMDTADASIGIPIRNMHTISETGVTDDVIATIHLLYETLFELSSMDSFKFDHPDLRNATDMSTI